MDGGWPLTGRQDDLLRVDAALHRAGGRRGLVLAGPAGAGRTRLAREAAARARRRGLTVRWVSATASARAVPLGAFAPLLVTVAGEPGHRLERAAEALVAAPAGPAAGGPPLLLVVDDAHLLDDLSATLVHQLVLGRRAAVLATVASGAPAPDAVRALWKDELVDRHELEPLSEGATAALLEAVLGAQVDSACARRLWVLSRGSTAFLRQLVEGGRRAGSLREAAGVWRWSGPPAITAALVELVTAQIGSLEGAVADVVDLLAVGEPLGFTVLVGLTGEAAVEEAESRGLVDVDRDGRRLQARLAHPLHGAVRREVIGRGRGRRLRGSLVTALAATGARRAGDTLRRAVLALDSDLAPGRELFIEASNSALGVPDFELAGRLAQRAAVGAGDFEAELVRACALTWLGRGGEADAALRALAARARTDIERTMAAVPRVGNLFCILGRPSEAEAVLAGTERALTDPEARLVLQAMGAVFHAWLGRAHRAVDVAQLVLASTGHSLAVVFSTMALTVGFGVLGRTGEAARMAARGYQEAARLPDAPMLRLGIADNHLLALRLAGHVGEAEALAGGRHRDSAEDHGPAQPMGAAMLGHAAMAAGRLRTATRRLREARAGLSAGDSGGWDLRCLMGLAQAHAMAGDSAGARRSLAEMEASPHPGFVLFDPEILLARAWVSASEGALGEAVALARRAADTAGSRGHLAYEVLALHGAVRLGHGGAAGRLAELAGRVDGPRAGLAAAHAAGLAAGDGDRLRAAAEGLEALGDHLAAADAAAHAAAAYRGRGRRDPAHAAAAHARRLAEACEGASTPALRAAARPLPLTGREREIATLATQGLSNRQIADRLVVSVRTVEGHLYRIGAKLDVRDRRELAAVLGVAAPPSPGHGGGPVRR